MVLSYEGQLVVNVHLDEMNLAPMMCCSSAMQWR